FLVPPLLGAQPVEQAAGRRDHLDPGQGTGAAGRQFGGQFFGGPERFGRHPVDQAQRQRLGGVEPAAGHGQFHRPAPAHQIGHHPPTHRHLPPPPRASSRPGGPTERTPAAGPGTRGSAAAASWAPPATAGPATAAITGPDLVIMTSRHWYSRADTSARSTSPIVRSAPAQNTSRPV